MEKTRKLAYSKYILAILLFGSNGIVAGQIALSSYEIVLVRAMIGSLLLVAIFFASKRRRGKEAGSDASERKTKTKKDYICIAISGIAMGASWMFLYEAYNQIGVSLATLTHHCGPVLVMVLAPFVFRERFSWAKVIGVVVILVGMVLVNRNEISQGGFSWGLVCGLLAAAMYVVLVIFNKKASGLAGIENAMYQLVFAFLTVAVFVIAKQGVHIDISAQSIPPILVLGILNTGIGCYMYFSAIPQLPAQSVAICGYLEPISALLFSAAFLGERLTALQWVGTVLVLGGAAFGEMYGARKGQLE